MPDQQIREYRIMIATGTASSETTEPKRKRRRFQFGMRMLLLAVFISCLGFGWLRLQLQEAREREAIVAELDKLRVYVYQYEPTALGRLTRTSRSFDYWLRARCGDSLLSSPSAISAQHISDDSVDYLIDKLSRFPALRTLHLGPLGKESQDRVQKAFPTVEVETARAFGLRPGMSALQPSGP